MRKLLLWAALWPAALPAAAQADGTAALRALVQQVSADSLASCVRTLVSFGTRHTLSTAGSGDQGIGAARRWVLSRFQQAAAASGGRMTARIDRWTQPADSHRVDRPVLMGNVMATLRGSDPADDRVLLVTAHLDSRNSDIMDSTGRAPGANDDGSGVAALIEMARLLSRHRLRATVVLAAVTGEEQGLLGAEHLAAMAQREGWHLEAMLNNDMIGQSSAGGTGNRDNTRVRVFSEGIPVAETPQQARLRRAVAGENDSPSRELARYLARIAEDCVDNLEVALMYRSDRFLRSGDQVPFQRRGFPAVRITDYYENYDHQHQDLRRVQGVEYGDLPAFMDFEYLRKTTSLNLAALASLANAPGKPREASIVVSRLENDTRLRWRPPSAGEVGGYRVLMRATEASRWQQAFFTRDTTMRLPYAKDNYFFAVQALGPDGLAGLPAFPGISR